MCSPTLRPGARSWCGICWRNLKAILRSHLQIDILLNVLKPRVRTIFTICATAVGTVFLVYLFILSLELVRSGMPNTSAGLGLPMSVPYTCVPVGTALMALTSVEVILKNLQELFHKKEGGAA